MSGADSILFVCCCMKFLSKLSSFHLGLLIVLGGAASYGLCPTASRAVYADGGNVTLVVLVMTWARALILGVFSLGMGKRLFATWGDLKESTIGGFFQTVSVFGFILALVYLPSPVVSIILHTYTLLLLMFMAWRGEIKLTVVTVVITLTVLGGLVLVIDPFHTQSEVRLIGAALAFMAALATATRLYVYGKQTKARYPTVVGAENFLIAAVLVSLCSLAVPPHLPSSSTGYIWLALSSVTATIGSFGMFYAISLIGSFRYSLFTKIEPVFTVLFSVVLVNEVLKPQQYIGVAVVICSLVIYQISEQRRKQ